MTTSRLYSSKKFIGAFLLMMVCVLPANAQFLRTSYFMEGTHYRQQLNPALIPTQGYFNIPVLGSVNATVGSTSLGYQDIIDIIDDSDNFYSNPDFLKRLKDKNDLNVNVSTEILSAGWYKGKNFWSFNVGVRADIGASLTRSMFTFLNEMDALEDNWRNSNYDISGQKLDINAYGEVGLGYARQINNRLTVGGKVKVLLGIGNMNLKINNVMMNAKLPSDARINQLQNIQFSSDPAQAAQEIEALRNEIKGYHANLAVNAQLESSFKGLELVEENGQDYISDFDFDSGKLGIAGYGFGIDLGASYKIMDNLTVSASVLDLGFIKWSKGATKIASANPEAINIAGDNYLFESDGTLAVGDSHTELYDFKNSTYAVRADGTLVSGKIAKIDGYQYYFNSKGKLQSNKIIHVGKHNYYFGKNGVLIKNKKIKRNGKIYYSNKNGVLSNKK